MIAIRMLFGIAAIYDFVIGMAFLCFGPDLFDATGVPQPNHWGYLQFASLMLMTFGAMFLAVAAAPVANRNLIPFGMMLKVSYTAVVAYWWMATGLPMLFKPFALIDVVMLVLFVLAYLELGRRRE